MKATVIASVAAPSIVALLLMATTSNATTRVVALTGSDNPGCAVPCRHIQFAIDQAQAGDLVLVEAGTYLENISLKSGVWVRSDQGATIQGDGLTQVVDISGTSAGTTLEGFVITGGNIGIVVFSAIADIRRNVITGNTGTQAGGIFIGDSSASITNNLIHDNSTTADGGAIDIESCTGVVSIINNTIDHNASSHQASLGQAISIIESTDVVIQNNIVSNRNAFSKTAIGAVGSGVML